MSLLDSLRTIWRKKAPMPTPDHTTLPFVVAGPHQCDAGCGRRATLEIVTHAGEPLFFCQPHFDEHQDALLGQCLETRRLEPQR